MRKGQNIWVDGSLRDGRWFAKVFDDVRRRFPRYKIAIFEIGASEDVVRYRIARRAAITGRNVPEHLIQASLASVASSLEILTPLVDFVARVGNDGAVPVLRAFIRVDSRGHWGCLQQQFAQPEEASTFPGSMAPLHLVSAPCEVLVVRGAGHPPELNAEHPDLAPVLPALKTRGTLELSPLDQITLLPEARELAGIPPSAVTFAFSYPAQVDWGVLSENYDTFRDSALSTPPCLVPLAGAFIYFDAAGQVCQVNAISELATVAQTEKSFDLDDPMLIQFTKPVALPAQAQLHLGTRLKPVTLASLLSKGAILFGWILPGERLPGLQNSPEGGAFVYVFKNDDLSGIPGARAIYFPVAT